MYVQMYYPDIYTWNLITILRLEYSIQLHIPVIDNTYHMLLDSSEIWDASRYSKYIRNFNKNRQL